MGQDIFIPLLIITTSIWLPNCRVELCMQYFVWHQISSILVSRSITVHNVLRDYVDIRMRRNDLLKFIVLESILNRNFVY